MRARIVRLLTKTLDSLVRRKNPDSTPEHLYTGRDGEDEAYFFLRQRGYVMVARNWRSPRRKGEVDLIGWDGDILCFIEVKTRTTRDVKPAEAAVDHDKRRELIAMAREYMRRMSRSRMRGRGDQPKYRFDVVSVYFDRLKRIATEITLFQDAFS